MASELSNLRELYLPDNHLNGTLPNEIGNLWQLQTLVLYGNEFTGNIPSTVGNLTHLSDFDLRDNYFSGRIPEEVGNMSELVYLYLESNQLSGPIPPTLGRLTQLVFFIVSANLLSGTVPLEIGDLVNLTMLVLSNNKLSGELPKELGGLSNIKYIDLSNNHLNNSLDQIAPYWQWPNLALLDLSQNEFVGSLPITTWKSNFPTLSLLSLRDNQLSGTIEPAFSNWTRLQIVDLSDNSFHGTLPLFDNLTWLTIFVADNNHFEGAIPSLRHNNYLNIFSVGNNQFRNKLPLLPTDMSDALILGFQNNHLSDNNITQWSIFCLCLCNVYNISGDLQILALFNNPGLTGSLPASVYNSNLRALLLHGCGISGELPWSNGSYGHTTFATISKNRLSGALPHSMFDTNQIRKSTLIMTFLFLFFFGTVLSLHFDISKKLSGGLYLTGNRMTRNKQWPNLVSNSQLPDYVSTDEKNAQNLCIRTEREFGEIMVVAIALALASFLFAFRLFQYPFFKQYIGEKWDLFRPQLLQNHVNFLQMKDAFEMLNSWLGIIVVIVLTSIYFAGSGYYSRGYPLSHLSLAYFESSSVGVTVVMLLTVLFSNGVVAAYAFDRLRNPRPYTASFRMTELQKENKEEAKENISTNVSLQTAQPQTTQQTQTQSLTFDWKIYVKFLLTLIGWMIAITCIFLYFAFAALPGNNTLNLSTTFLYLIQQIMSLVFSIHNSFIAKDLAFYTTEIVFYHAGIKHRSSVRKYHNALLVILRSFACVFVPIVTALFFYDNCARAWVHYWIPCAQSNPEDVVVGYEWNVIWLIVGEVTAKGRVVGMKWNDICHNHQYQPGKMREYVSCVCKCIREILEKWGNIIVIQKVFDMITPWLFVGCRKFVSWANIYQPSSYQIHIEILDIYSNLELTFLLGLFCPLVIPLSAMALFSYYCTYQYLLYKDKRYTLSEQFSAFPFWILAVPFFFQQIVWMLLSIHNDSMFSSSSMAIYLLCCGLIAIDCCFMAAISISCWKNGRAKSIWRGLGSYIITLFFVSLHFFCCSIFDYHFCDYLMRTFSKQVSNVTLLIGFVFLCLFLIKLD
ncbi:hypothetical protein RFI_25532 [Reticulomyxa filosa]|uniref:Uncharacterized protein n=1 Tax=Reticulomyxa filosa TaxID=46433 RepID=X6MD80_RETFI|nr:hypothetical protein RFI_25532 [Reticulomyxa filosa]|eukprot:ETO11844.1 hypothetical protein RFI_25532 [Reticulomyxa filosa]